MTAEATAVDRPTQTPQAPPTHTPTASPTYTSVPTATPVPPPTFTATPQPAMSAEVIGYSVNGTPLRVTSFGNGPSQVVFVGGLHAGFAPSTVTLAEMAIDHFQQNPNEIPDDITLSIIVNANPDSPWAPGELAGRLNANNVDLNRNWGCDWNDSPVWRNNPISGGSKAFSEPESTALADYFSNRYPVAVVFWEARMEDGYVAAGGCLADAGPLSQTLATTYGNAANYTVASWDYYPVNGDATNWLDYQGIAAASVLIRDYKAVDWDNNLRGIRAVLDRYGD
jgi:hypothetical protein